MSYDCRFISYENETEHLAHLNSSPDPKYLKKTHKVGVLSVEEGLLFIGKKLSLYKGSQKRPKGKKGHVLWQVVQQERLP